MDLGIMLILLFCRQWNPEIERDFLRAVQPLGGRPWTRTQVSWFLTHISSPSPGWNLWKEGKYPNRRHLKIIGQMTINYQTSMMIPVIYIYPIWFYSSKAQCNYWHPRDTGLQCELCQQMVLPFWLSRKLSIMVSFSPPKTNYSINLIVFPSTVFLESFHLSPFSLPPPQRKPPSSLTYSTARASNKSLFPLFVSFHLPAQSILHMWQEWSL